MFHLEHFGARNWQKPLELFFPLQMVIVWLRIGLELKFVSLELPENEDSEYVLKNFLACL
jgi:hypothetical protein